MTKNKENPAFSPSSVFRKGIGWYNNHSFAIPQMPKVQCENLRF